MTNHLLCQFNNNLDCPCKQGAKESNERRQSTNPLHGIDLAGGSGQSQTVTLNMTTSNNAGDINFANFIQEEPAPEWNVPEHVEVELAQRDEAITVDDIFNHLERDR